MSKKPKIQVIKVETQRPAFRPKKFPSQPRMYLELIENKAKIRQDLVNKEYVPPPQSGNINNLTPIQEEPEDIKEEYEEQNYKKNDRYSDDESDKRSVSSESDKDSVKRYSEDENERSYKRSKSDSDRSYKKSKSTTDDEDERPYRRSRSDNDSDDDSDRKGYKLKSRSSSSGSDDESSDDELTSRIKQLLKKDKSKSKSVEGYSPSPIRNEPKTPPNNRQPAPSLKDLEQQGVYQQKKVMRDLSQPNVVEQNEEDLKRELLFKFEILKKQYPQIELPEFTIHSDLNTMQKTYETMLKRVTLETNVDSYKTYLIGGFMLVEFVLSNWFKLDMSGFTQQQMVSMNSYERLLIELGEKSYVPVNSQWPVEVRLLFMILVNAGFFVVTKMLMKKTGANLLNMMNSAPQVHNTSGENMKKRKMRGPDLNLQDIPDL